MRRIILIGTMLFALAATFIGRDAKVVDNDQQATGKALATTSDKRIVRKTKIQVAILLDTSSSMDGLIEQAKSRIWNIVNTLTTLKYNNRTPQIEIALYEYGNNGISSDDYIRQVTPLTTDLDLISQRLFALTTWGGSEYCGAVINKAVRDLDWGRDQADMKLIYIAGNEPFTQGSIPYKDAISRALEKNIYVNTIHCGNSRSGIDGMWRDGAIRGKGKYFNIDHNARVMHVDTPYDADIARCNQRLNDTYISYGSYGFANKENQIKQDNNAMTISSANYAERALSKSRSAYKNESWDLVDRVSQDEMALEKIEKKDLPKELQEKTKAEITAEVKKKEAERKVIQKEINELAKKRQEYIDAQKKTADGDDLGVAINSSILEFANSKGYIAEKK